MSNASGRSREMSSENSSLNLAVKGPFVILAKFFQWCMWNRVGVGSKACLE